MQALGIRQFDSPSVGPGWDDEAENNERQTFLPHHHPSHVVLVDAYEPRQLFGEDQVGSKVGQASETEQGGVPKAIGRLAQSRFWFNCFANKKKSLSANHEHGSQDKRDFGSILKYSLSMGMLLFSLCLVLAAVLSRQTKTSLPCFVSLGVMTSLILWLGMMEGGQGCLVGLQPVDKYLYEQSHPIALKCTQLAHEGDNMNRFIVGRQFLVVLVVFVINLCGSVQADIDLAGVAHTLVTLFLSSGLATILLTVVLGQLTAQVNATNCMLDFVNTHFMLFTTWVSLAIEMTGLLHAVYLVQYCFAVYSGQPVKSAEGPRSTAANIWFWLRVLVSSLLVGAAMMVTIVAIFKQQTTMWQGVPALVSVMLLFCLMTFVGLMEGMQIALFCVIKMNEEELQQHSVARANCDLVFEGSNFAKYLIGRQICVTLCMFIVARITTITVDPTNTEDRVMGVSQGMQEFLNTGLPGALITTIIASLAWRIIASAFPIAFMSNPMVYWTIHLCLLLEASGICSAAWLLAAVQKYFMGFQADEVYLVAASEKCHDMEGKVSDDTASEVSSDDSKFADYGATSPVVDRRQP